MVDHLTPEKRSWNMSRVKSEDTRPEMKVRRLLFSMGFRYRINVKAIPGKPDIVLKKWNAVILEESVSEKYTISNRLWKSHIDRSARNVARVTGFTAYTVDLEKKDGKECLIPQNDKNPRMLTPRECARLQGFPEKFILPAARTWAY